MSEMQAKSDAELLREFAARGNDAAFTEIVTRYTDFVYSAALRQVASSAAASDIAQNVFTDLARKAAALARAQDGPPPSLAGWLHRATRYAALNHLRDARRRLHYERQAMEQLLTDADSPADWEQIRPLLDEALDSLGAEDREALLLRYFKNQDFRAVGQALGVSDDAAQKRVSRALERLRELLPQRKVAAGAAGLALLLSANAVQAAPAGLAAALATTALTGAAVPGGAVLAATKTIAMTALQKSIIAAALITAVGTAVYQGHQAAVWRAQAQALSAPPPAATNDEALALLHGRLSQLATQNTALFDTLDKVSADKKRLEKQLEDARRATALYRDLANQATASNSISTNDFPTQRQAFAEMGRKFRQIAVLKSQDTADLSENEKAANKTAMIQVVQDVLHLAVVMGQLDGNPAAKEASTVTQGSCLLYGALDLSDAQFTQVYNLLQRYQDQANQQQLLKTDAPPEAATTLGQLEKDEKAELQTLFTPDQNAIFDQIESGINLVKGSFNMSL